MMWSVRMHSFPLNTIPKTDWIFYGLSAVLGVTIALTSYYIQPATVERNSLDRYMEQVLARMDSVSVQLGQWGNIDIRQGR